MSFEWLDEVLAGKTIKSIEPGSQPGWVVINFRMPDGEQVYLTAFCGGNTHPHPTWNRELRHYGLVGLHVRQGGRGQTAYVRDDRDPEMRLNACGWEQWWKRSVERHDQWDDEMKSYYPYGTCNYLYNDPHTGKIIDRCDRPANEDAYGGFCEDHQPMTEEQVDKRAEAAQKIRQGE
jgi:hypothetical protein